MKLPLITKKPLGRFALVLLVSLMFQGCAMQWGAEIQGDSRSQILISEESQVKLRSIQTRVFDTTDRAKILRVAVATMQDLFFDIDVLDEELGIVSGKKWFNHESPWADHPTYYRTEERRSRACREVEAAPFWLAPRRHSIHSGSDRYAPVVLCF